jgi:ell wall binding domain 2 (CWB2)/WD40-like Beta Propeller Repeat
MLVLALLIPASTLSSAPASAAESAAVASSVPIAFDSSTSGPVDVVALNGAGARNVGPADASSPTWLPDGSALAVTTSSKAGIAVVSATATSSKQVVTGFATHPDFSPDGSQLLYYTSSGSSFGISVANADGSDAHVVWSGSKGVILPDLGFFASWAPDSSSLAFDAFPAGCLEGECTLPMQVWVVNADGTGLHQVPGAADIPHVTWSPDGQWLLGDGLAEIHPDGTGRHNVGPADATFPVWSPDGSQIAYEKGKGDTVAGTALWIVNADGSADHAADSPPGQDYDAQPQWLPDGSGLVFTRETVGSSLSNITASIQTVKSDGTGLRKLANGQDPAVPVLATRLAGATRIDTAIALSRASYPSASTIVIARDDLYPDALAAGPLAAKLHGPLLLSPPAAVPAAVAAEVKRLGAKTAYLIGDTTALSADVEAGLRAAGVTTINRIGGASRYETAALIAEQIGGTSVYVARGDDFPDAASVAGLAAFQQRPILLTTPDSLSTAALAAINDLQATRATIVGGTSAVSDEVAASIAAVGVSATRVSGSTRYGTSAAVATLALAAGMTGPPWLTDGANWPDALSAGPAVAVAKGNLLLVDPDTLANSPDSLGWLTSHPPTTVVTVGGPDVVSPSDVLTALTGR